MKEGTAWNRIRRSSNGSRSRAASCCCVGGLDTGKTTLGRAIAPRPLRDGRPVAYLDADLGQKAVGPPATVGLRMICGDAPTWSRTRSPGPTRWRSSASISPQGQLLPAGGRRRAGSWTGRFENGADLVVVDTSGLVSGVYGQILKYHKVEMLRPDVVIGLQRGAELDPLLGHRAAGSSPPTSSSLPVHPDVQPDLGRGARRGPRDAPCGAYFAEPLQRWRVKPTVFMPALPSLFDLSQLAPAPGRPVRRQGRVHRAGDTSSTRRTRTCCG